MRTSILRTLMRARTKFYFKIYFIFAPAINFLAILTKIFRSQLKGQKFEFLLSTLETNWVLNCFQKSSEYEQKDQIMFEK